MSEVEHAYQGSDADKTRAVYLRLMEHGQVGDIAVNLLRTSKASERAKQYRGGRFVRAAYEKKDWAIGELCKSLVIHADDLGIVWGWGRDEKTTAYENVLYVELPGQVSFHTSHRGEGPGYRGQWDGVRGEGARRIIAFANSVLDGSLNLRRENDGTRQNRPEGTPTAPAAGPEIREGEQEAFNF